MNMVKKKMFKDIPNEIAGKLETKMKREIDLRIFKELQKEEKFQIYLLTNFDINIAYADSQSIEITDKEKGINKVMMQIPVKVDIRKRKFFEKFAVKMRILFERLELWFSKPKKSKQREEKQDENVYRE